MFFLRFSRFPSLIAVSSSGLVGTFLSDLCWAFSTCHRQNCYVINSEHLVFLITLWTNGDASEVSRKLFNDSRCNTILFNTSTSYISLMNLKTMKI